MNKTTILQVTAEQVRQDAELLHKLAHIVMSVIVEVDSAVISPATPAIPSKGDTRGYMQRWIFRSFMLQCRKITQVDDMCVSFVGESNAAVCDFIGGAIHTMDITAVAQVIMDICYPGVESFTPVDTLYRLTHEFQAIQDPMRFTGAYND